jgi:binding-protein-dependent transport system inner membrane component
MHTDTSQRDEVPAQLAHIRARMAAHELDAIVLALTATLLGLTADAVTDSVKAQRIERAEGLADRGFELAITPWYRQGVFVAAMRTRRRDGGASVFRIWWQIILPLCRPALAALATLEFTWKWNDYLWVITLIQSTDNTTVTLGLSGLRGEFVTNWNLISAASLLAAIPTVAVYLVPQRQFLGGLFVGSNK